jgi:hypothetical protein
MELDLHILLLGSVNSVVCKFVVFSVVICVGYLSLASVQVPLVVKKEIQGLETDSLIKPYSISQWPLPSRMQQCRMQTEQE